VTNTGRGGRVSPLDRPFREALRRIALWAWRDQKRQFIWIGYDNEADLVARGSYSAELAGLAAAMHQFLCWKALMVVEPLSQDEARVTVLHIGADAAYALNVNGASNKASWVRPDQFVVRYLRQLYR